MISNKRVLLVSYLQMCLDYSTGMQDMHLSFAWLLGRGGGGGGGTRKIFGRKGNPGELNYKARAHSEWFNVSSRLQTGSNCSSLGKVLETGYQKGSRFIHNLFFFCSCIDQSGFKNVISLHPPYLGAIQERNRIWVLSLPRLHSAPIPGSNPGRWVRSVLQGFIDPLLHSDPANKADPASGAERTSSSKK